MTEDEFKLCNKCPTHSRHFDSDGYWCCKHPKAWEHAYDLEEGSRTKYTPDTPSGYETGDDVPVACLKTCPCNHWKRTIEGGKIPKTQTELIIDAERMA
ncbi:MAG: hypothetical protein M0Q91_14385 [Methanoregula sp.]|jgi:hypothetical protein|nr:hypothetical protein [Methanoregula sp.]